MPLPAAVGSALVSAGGSLVSGLLGLASQKSSNKSYLTGVRETNEANREMVREQNAANLAAQREQNEWNLRQWNRENEYNTPGAQRQRLFAAGVSPASMMSNGNASALQVANGFHAEASRDVAPGQTPNAYAPLAQSIGGASSDFIGSLRQYEDLKQSKYQTFLAGVSASTALERSANELKKQVLELESQGNLNKEQRLDLDEKKIRLSKLEQILSLQMSNMQSEFDNSQKQGRLIDAQINEQQSATLRLDRQSEANVRHMSVQDAVSYMLAHAQVNLSEKEAKQVEFQTAKTIGELMFDMPLQRKMRKLEMRLQYAKHNLDAQQQSLFARMMGYKIQSLNRQSKSFIRNAVLEGLGIDISDIFGISAGASYNMLSK